MKYFATFFTFFLCIAVFGIRVEAQPNSYYGLRIGQKYSSEQIIQAIGDSGIHRWQLDGETRMLRQYVFSNVTYEGRHFSSMKVFTLLSDSTFVGIRLLLVDESVDGSSNLNEIYIELAEELSTKYNMKHLPAKEGESTSSLEFRNPFGPSVFLDRVYSNDNITEIALSFVSTAEIEVDLIMNGPGYQPTIQDTFSKLKLGKKYRAASIESSLKRNGTFLSESKKSEGTLIVFCNFKFANHLWDYAEVWLTRKGVFRQFRVYDGYSTIASEEIVASKSLYESIN